jgi:hypothetical protein
VRHRARRDAAHSVEFDGFDAHPYRNAPITFAIPF